MQWQAMIRMYISFGDAMKRIAAPIEASLRMG